MQKMSVLFRCYDILQFLGGKLENFPQFFSDKVSKLKASKESIQIKVQ